MGAVVGTDRRWGGLGEALVVLLVDVGVEIELDFEGVDLGGLGLDVVGDVVAFGQLFAAVGESLFAEVVDLVEGDAFEFHLAAEFGDEGVDGVVLAFGVEDDETFVFALHVDSVGLGTLGAAALGPGDG